MIIPINQVVKNYYAVNQYNSSSFLIACSRIARVLPLSASWRTKSSSGLTSSNASKGSRFSLAFNTSTGKRGLFIATIHHSGSISAASTAGGVWRLLSAPNLKNVRLLFASVLHHIRSGCFASTSSCANASGSSAIIDA